MTQGFVLCLVLSKYRELQLNFSVIGSLEVSVGYSQSIKLSVTVDRTGLWVCFSILFL
jgi:hypothetical protein